MGRQAWRRSRFPQVRWTVRRRFNVSEPTITCPKCKSEIRLTESLAAPLLEQTRVEFQQKLSAKDLEIARREEAVAKSTAEVEQARK